MSHNDNNVYVSVDVETDGPIPGPYSMLSLGAVAFRPTGEAIGTFQGVLETLPGASQHPDTMSWWKKYPEAWAKATDNPRPPEMVMKEFVEWLDTLPSPPTFIGWPATWDFMFIFWYLIRFIGRSPFGHSGLCIKSQASDRLKTPFRQIGKRTLPKPWFAGTPKHDHDPINDAMEQGILWLNMTERRNPK